MLFSSSEFNSMRRSKIVIFYGWSF